MFDNIFRICQARITLDPLILHLQALFTCEAVNGTNWELDFHSSFTAIFSHLVCSSGETIFHFLFSMTVIPVFHSLSQRVVLSKNTSTVPCKNIREYEFHPNQPYARAGIDYTPSVIKKLLKVLQVQIWHFVLLKKKKKEVVYCWRLCLHQISPLLSVSAELLV